MINFRLGLWRQMAVAALMVLLGAMSSRGQENGYDRGMGPLGGTCRLTGGQNSLRVTRVDTGTPADFAGLQVNDFIHGAFGEEFGTSSLGDSVWNGTGMEGAFQDLGLAVERAESWDGMLPLRVLRSGVGDITITVLLVGGNGFGPAYPLNSSKYSALYEYACSNLNLRVMSCNGDMGYLSAYAGLALLGHPDALSTNGLRPYRLSLDKIMAFYTNKIATCTYAPVEPDLLDGSANPNANGGMSNWELGPGVMFLAEYRNKTGNSGVSAVLQRGAEVSANCIQWWNENGHLSSGYDYAGRTGHGGVDGDYRTGSYGMDITGIQMMSGMALAERAGVNMNVRPRDGHYYGYTNAPAGAVPAGMENYNHSLTEKLLMVWNYCASLSGNNSGTDEMWIAYCAGYGSAEDSGCRTPGTLFGIATYYQGRMVDAATSNKIARLKARIARRYNIQNNCHVCTEPGPIFQQLATSYLSDRQRRYYMDNWRFFYNFSRTPYGTIQYQPGRGSSDAGCYLSNDDAALINCSLPLSVARGGLPDVPGYNTNCIIANILSPWLKWPDLDYKYAKLTNSVNSFVVDITDGNGNVIDPGSYTARWKTLSGPGTVAYGNPNAALSSITFPVSGQYTIQLTATNGARNVTEKMVFDVALTPSTVSKPSITTQPVSQVIALGSNVTFNVAVQGDAPIIYQWRLNGVAYWGPNSTAALNLSNVGGGLAGNYDCIISAAGGVVTSAVATLFVTDVGTVVMGGLWRDVYLGIGGSAVSDLTAASKFPRFSDASGVITNAEAPADYSDNYGQRWTGWIIPRTNTQYRFYIASDDASELWLSLDEYAAHKARIASVGCVSSRAWQSVTPSAYISLNAGQRYYIEARHKEGGSSDNLAVVWQKSGDPAPTNGAAPIEGAYLQYQTGGIFSDAVPVPPIANEDDVSLFAGTPAVIDVVSNDFDANNETLRIVAVTAPSHGGAGLTGPRTLGYVPVAGFTGSDRFTYVVMNALGLTDTGTVTVQVVDPAANLDGRWRLDETSGVVATDSAGSHNGAFMNGPTLGQGGAATGTGSSVAFNGVNQYVNVLMNVSETGYAVSFWFRTTQSSEGLYSVSDGGTSFDRTLILSGGNISAYIWSGETITSSGRNFADDQWHQVVHTYGASVTGQRLYVDGLLVASGSKSQSDFNWENRLTIGYAANGANTYFLGSLDDVRVFNRALSDVEAKQLYAAAVGSSNQPPFFTTTPVLKVGATSGLPYSDTLAGSVADPNPGDVLTYGKISGSAWLAIAAGGALSGIPAAGNIGTNSFVVSATDSGALSTQAVLQVVVESNRPPSFVANPVVRAAATAGVPYSDTLIDSVIDPNRGDTPAFGKISGPAWLAVSSGGLLSGIASPADMGTNTFSVRAIDTAGLAVTGTVQIIVLCPVMGAGVPALIAESCTPTNGALDPGEVVTIAFGLANLGTGPVSNGVGTLLSSAGVFSPSSPQFYGLIATGGVAVTRTFSFTALGPCGGAITAVVQVADGPVNLGMVTNIFTLGQAIVTFTQNFDGVPEPTLPSGWSTWRSGGLTNWMTSTTQRDTLSNSVSAGISATPSSNAMVSPAIAILSPSARLTFRNYYNLENYSSTVGYDGGVLDIKIGSGNWTDIIQAGGSFAAKGYNTTIDSGWSNPLTNRPAWSGNSGGFVTTIVNLPFSAAGQSVQLRWVCGTDDGTTSTGWWIDTISILDAVCATCSSADLDLLQAVSPSPATNSASLTYSLTVLNRGPSAATGVVITNTLPGAVTFFAANSSQGTVATNGVGQVIAALGTLTSNASASVSILVIPNGVGMITNTAVVASSSADPNTADNTSVAVTVVNPAVAAWINSAASGFWSAPSSWSPAAVPREGWSAIFGAGGSTALVDTVSRVIENVVFSRPASFVVAGSGGAGLMINSGVRVANVYTHSLAVPVTLGGPNLWDVRGGGTLVVNNTLAGSCALTKTGAGLWRMEGVGLGYTGAITVAGGTLLLSGLGSLGGPVVVTSNSTVAGTGTLASSVTIDSGGILAPGPLSGAGTLTVSGTLAVSTGAVMQISLGSTSDRVVVGGDLALGGVLNIADSGGFTNGTYLLFTYQGALANNGVVIGTTPNSNLVYSLDTGTVGQIRLSALSPARLGVSPASYDFGTIATGSTAQASFTVTNLGQIALGGSASVSSPFVVAAGTPFSVAGGGGTNITVKYIPPAITSSTAFVTFVTTGGNSTNRVTGAAGVPPTVSFTGSPVTGTASLGVTFNDTSSGVITNRAWSFGDGGTTNTLATNVVHIYRVGGTNTVTLTIEGVVAASNTRTNYVIVAAPASSIWTNSSASGTWSDAFNWDPVAVPDGGTVVSFGTGGTTSLVDTVARSVGSLVFDRSANFNLSGVGLNVSSGITVKSNYTYRINAPLTLTGTNRWTVNGAGILSVSGALSGSSPITKAGPGKLIFSASNTCNGVMTVEAGTLQIGEGGTVGSVAGSVSNNATLVFNRGDDFGYSAGIKGAGPVVKEGGGTLFLSGGGNSYSGATLVTAGTVVYSNLTTALNSGTISNAAAVVFYMGIAGSNVVNSSLSGAGSYTIDGIGFIQQRVVLRGNGSDNSGPVKVINGAKLWLDQGPNAIGDAAVMDIGTFAQVFMEQGISETIGGLSGSGVIRGGNLAGTATLTVGGGNVSALFCGAIKNGTTAMALVKAGSGTQTLVGSNLFSGVTLVNGGALWVDGSLAQLSQITVNGGGTLGGTGKVYGVVTIASGGQLSPGPLSGGGVLTLASNLTIKAGGVVQVGLGTVSDGIAVGGNLVLGGTVNVTDAGGFTTGAYTLITYSGSLSNNGVVVGTTPSNGYVYQIDTNMAGQVRLVVMSPFAAWQIQYFHSLSDTNAASDADPDGDKMSNYDEYLAGTDPSNAASRLMITNAAFQNVTGRLLIWPSVSGRVYEVERSTNLIEGGFIGIFSNLPAGGGWNTVTDNFNGTPVFYRIKAGLIP